jgi:hypothetical protein
VHQAPLLGADQGAGPAGLPTWASLPVYGSFATAHAEGLGLPLPRLDQSGWGEASGPVDLVLREDRLAE